MARTATFADGEDPVLFGENVKVELLDGGVLAVTEPGADHTTYYAPGVWLTLQAPVETDDKPGSPAKLLIRSEYRRR